MKLLTVNFFEYADKEWRWNLKSKNGKIIADSGEGYKRRSDARKSFNLIVGYAHNASVKVNGVLVQKGVPRP